MFLKKEIFKSVVENVPLVSIDLVVENMKSQFLLGKRINKPAQGYWFVPGGRVMKGESLEEGFLRIALSELGEDVTLQDSKFLGVFEHFYKDSMFDNSISTHYVALAYHIQISSEFIFLPLKEQHLAYQWKTKSDLSCDNDCHEYTKNYIKTLN